MPFSSLGPGPGDPRAAIIRDPLVVSPETAVLDAIAQMSHLPARQVAAEPSPTHRLRANCAVVVDQQQVVGIFTEHDVVCLVAQQQPLQGVPLAQVMTHPVITGQKPPCQTSRWPSSSYSSTSFVACRS
jgi:CBS domain-containing protein